MPKHQHEKRRIVLFAISFLYFCLGIVPFSKADLSASLADGDSLDLIGIGMHQELLNDIYIGALFVPPSVNDVKALKNDNVAKRLSLRFVSNYSHRKMARHWKERLAMNNSRTKWQPMTREIVAFSRLFKRNMEPGDEVNIDHIPGTGTQVYLNGTLFMTFNKPGFVDLLLNVWLGNNPPTKAFSKSIRGRDPQSTKDTFVARFTALQPVPGRFDPDLVAVNKVASVSKQTGSPQVNKVAKAPISKASPKPKNTPTKNNITQNKQAKPIAAKVKAKEPESVKIADVNSEQFDTAPAADPNSLSQANKQQDKADLKQAAKLELTELSSNIKLDPQLLPQQKSNIQKTASLDKPAESQAEPEDGDLFDADLLAGSYTRDLINSIRKYQKYPKEAFLKGDEGDVTVKVNIDALGELVSVVLIERSGSRFLDKAVTRMVKRAAPFQAIPEELKLQEFEFQVPVTFKL